MDFEKYTDRAKGFVQAAQNLAHRENHQQFGTDHLLKVLLDDPEGLASSGLIARAGGQAQLARNGVDVLMAKRPKVSGGGAGPGLRGRLNSAALFDRAQKIAEKAGDSSSTVAFAAGPRRRARARPRVLLKNWRPPQGLNQAINELHRRTADSASARQAYDALKRYARDLTAAAAEGVDPVIGRGSGSRTIQVLSRRRTHPVLTATGRQRTAIWKTSPSASSEAKCNAGTGSGARPWARSSPARAMRGEFENAGRAVEVRIRRRPYRAVHRWAAHHRRRR